MVTQRAPKRRRGQPKIATRMRFTHVMIELMATINGYPDAVTRLNLNIGRIEILGRFNRSVANISEDDVVRFLAKHGVRFKQMADGWQYTRQWLRDSATGNGYNGNVVAEMMRRAEQRSTGRPTASTLPLSGMNKWWHPAENTAGGRQYGSSGGTSYPPGLTKPQLIERENTQLRRESYLRDTLTNRNIQSSWNNDEQDGGAEERPPAIQGQSNTGEAAGATAVDTGVAAGTTANMAIDPASPPGADATQQPQEQAEQTREEEMKLD